jgi:aarF domain-containing kinase
VLRACSSQPLPAAKGGVFRREKASHHSDLQRCVSMRFTLNPTVALFARRALATSSAGGGKAKVGWSPFKKALVAGTVLAGAGGGLWLSEREESRGARRSARFWVQIFPIFLHYKWTQHVTCMEFSLAGRSPIDEAVADEHWHALHQKYAGRVHGIMTDMGGFYFKTGQLMSTRDDFVPPEYLGFFKQLQDAAPPRPFEHVKSVVERELGQQLQSLFKSFEETACGAASIGQVHRAVLQNGHEVAVKVMYPGVEQMFRSDLKTVKDFCRLAMPQHLPALDEIERQFVTEFDYRKEAANLNEVQRNLQGVWDHVAVVPRAHVHMCTQNVLVMDYLPGVKLVSAIRAQFARFAAAQGKTMEQLEAELKASQGGLKPPGKRTVQAYALWLKIHDGTKNIQIRLWNWLGGWWGRTPQPLVHTEVPINLYHIIDIMLKVSSC